MYPLLVVTIIASRRSVVDNESLFSSSNGGRNDDAGDHRLTTLRFASDAFQQKSNYTTTLGAESEVLPSSSNPKTSTTHEKVKTTSDS
jgi:hypothetical protein